MSRSPTRRKCRCCSKFFIPEPQTADRQRYCSRTDCRQASKLASQRRWVSKNGNGDYFRGPNDVQPVQAWRRDHPGYWRKQTPSSRKGQAADKQPANPDQSSRNVPRGLPRTLQDDCLTQDPAFVGLISMVTGSTLQEDIATTARQLLLRGRNILGVRAPGNHSTTSTSIMINKHPAAARSAAPHPPELQLGGPPPGPPRVPAPAPNRAAWALYLFLVTVADVQGLSYYSDAAIAGV